MAVYVSSDSTRRKALVCDSNVPVCIECRGVIRRVRPLAGGLLATCDNRPPRHAGPDRKRCGQHVHILGMPEGVCLVIAITPEEFREVLSGQAPVFARDLYARLGDVFPLSRS